MIHRFALVALLAGAWPLHGQDTVAPGSAVLRTSLLREGTVEFTILSEVDGEERVWGRERYETTFAERDGTPVVVSTRRFWTEDGTEGEPHQTDVYTFARASLSPLSQDLELAIGGNGRIRFDGGRMRGTFGDGSTIDVPIESPGFHLDVLDLVLGSLPLRTGFETVLATFDPDDGTALRYRVAVRGEETVPTEDGGRCRGWRVEVDGLGGVAKYWIAPDTRELVAYQPAPTTRGIRRTGCPAPR